VFLARHRDVLDRPSFPTRRSSDLHPEYTPDQVKGALMVTARQVSVGALDSAGAGEITAAKAAGMSVKPPNPNAALDKYLVSDGRSEEHTSELQSRSDLVCRLLLEK